MSNKHVKLNVSQNNIDSIHPTSILPRVLPISVKGTFTSILSDTQDKILKYHPQLFSLASHIQSNRNPLSLPLKDQTPNRVSLPLSTPPSFLLLLPLRPAISLV